MLLQKLPPSVHIAFLTSCSSASDVNVDLSCIDKLPSPAHALCMPAQVPASSCTATCAQQTPAQLCTLSLLNMLHEGDRSGVHGQHWIDDTIGVQAVAFQPLRVQPAQSVTHLRSIAGARSQRSVIAWLLTAAAWFRSDHGVLLLKEEHR